MRNQFKTKTLSFFVLFLTTILTGLNAQSGDIVVIDTGYSQKQEVLESLPEGASIVELGQMANPWKLVRQYLEQNQSAQVIHLFANTSYNAIELGGTTYDSAAIEKELELSMLEGLYQGTNIQLLIYDCNLGSNTEGLALIKKISDRSYFNIAVPTNCSSVFSSTLEFDHTTMNQPINSSIFK